MGSVPVGMGPKTAVEPIVGRVISADEWAKIPKELRYSFRAVKPSLVQKIVGAVSSVLATRSSQGGGGGGSYRCPLCVSTDPDVTILVINACSLGAAKGVSVECVNGHYAFYPCPRA